MTYPEGVLANLPPELHYLIDAAQKYGIYETDDDRMGFLERAELTEMDELSRVAERYRREKHADLVSDFFDDCPITEFPESAKLHSLLAIMDLAGFSLSPDDWNSLETHIKALSRFGSFRLASERAIAAKFLADYGENGRAAIPALRSALQDEDLRVQVWAHFALARLVGNVVEHQNAVREIYSRYDQKDELGCHVDEVGGEACEVLEKFRQLASNDV